MNIDRLKAICETGTLDIAAAWQIVPILPFFRLTRYHDKWLCESSVCDTPGPHTTVRNGIAVCGCRYAWADNPPLAIYRAAMKLYTDPPPPRQSQPQIRL